MISLDAFGLVAVTLLLLLYAIERRSRLYTLALCLPADWAPPMLSCKARGLLAWLRQLGPWSPFDSGGLFLGLLI